MKPSFYAPFPNLQRAIATARQARIMVATNRNATTMYRLEQAILTEHKIRQALAPAIRAHREVLAYDLAHARRYDHLYARKSRTIETATALRLQREARRQQARINAERKRADNRSQLSKIVP